LMLNQQRSGLPRFARNDGDERYYEESSVIARNATSSRTKCSVIANKMHCHCERSEAIQSLMLNQQRSGLPRFARNDGDERYYEESSVIARNATSSRTKCSGIANEIQCHSEECNDIENEMPCHCE
jgi:hypothetical protein